jgi:hypothetical protein
MIGQRSDTYLGARLHQTKADFSKVLVRFFEDLIS